MNTVDAIADRLRAEGNVLRWEAETAILRARNTLAIIERSDSLQRTALERQNREESN